MSQCAGESPALVLFPSPAFDDGNRREQDGKRDLHRQKNDPV